MLHADGEATGADAAFVTLLARVLAVCHGHPVVCGSRSVVAGHPPSCFCFRVLLTVEVAGLLVAEARCGGRAWAGGAR